MSTLAEYITVRRQTIAVYVVTHPVLIECRRGERKRGAVLHRWWWEQHMDLDVDDAIGSDEIKFHSAEQQQGKQKNNWAICKGAALPPPSCSVTHFSCGEYLCWVPYMATAYCVCRSLVLILVG